MTRICYIVPRLKKGIDMREWPKLKLRDWLEQRLVLEGSHFWTDTERRDVCEKLARDYQPGNGGWHVRPGDHTGENRLGRPVYLVVRGELEIHSDENEEKARAVARALQNLDRTVSDEGS